MATIFLSILNMSIAASWLILAVLVFRLFLKRAPKWISCLLWAFVALRLLFPFTIESIFSVIPSAKTVSTEIMYQNEPTINSGINSLNQLVNPVLKENLSPSSMKSVNSLQVWTALATYLWLLGILVVLLYAGFNYYRIHRRVKASLHLRDDLWTCDEISSPFILGILRPRIYLPSGTDEKNLNVILAHEHAHLKRLDHLWKPLAFLLLSIYWFNPLLWIAYILLCRDIELACDEKVIRDMDKEERLAYSQALFSCSSHRRMIMICPLAFGEVGIKDRITSVLNYKKPAFWMLLPALLSCVFLAACFLTNPKEEKLPFGHAYQVDDVVYDEIQFSFAYIKDTAPFYKVDKEGELLKMERKEESWKQLGQLEEIQLDEKNFDPYFLHEDEGLGWNRQELSAEQLRLQNKGAWRVDVKDDPNDVFYLLLEQKNGDLYLCNGYDASAKEEEVKAVLMRWVFALRKAENINIQENTQEEFTFLFSQLTETPNQIPEALDAAVSKAILERNKGESGKSGDFQCEAHVILGTENHADRVTVFAQVMTKHFGLSDEGITDEGGSHIPTAITLNKLEDGKYSLKEYWIPRDGEEYEKDLRAKFPKNIVELALNTELYSLRLEQSCYEQLASSHKISAEKTINKLLLGILDSPKSSSNPMDYIDEHQLEYRQLTYFGVSTLRFCFSEFLKGDQTDLRGQVMAHLCREILVDFGEIAKDEKDYATGQEWFDGLKNEAEGLHEKPGQEK